MARTVGTAREILHVGAKDCPSLIVKVLAFLQVDTPETAAPSIPDELQLTTQSLLASLPSSSIFLYLPEDITSYRPFIDLDSPSSIISQDVLTSKLRDWIDSAVTNLKSTIKGWLSKLESVRAVWDVQNFIQQLLNEDNIFNADERERIWALINAACQSRVKEIWDISLKAMESSFKISLASLLNGVKEEHVDSEQGLLKSLVPAVTHS